MMAGVELGCASGHEVSNQQSEKKSFANLDRLGKTGRYLQLRSITFLRYMISTQDQFKPF